MQAEQSKAEGATSADVRLSQKNERSSIDFPYGDLDGSVAFAKAVNQVGGTSCTVEQLAGYLKKSPTSGAFRGQLANPRIFGLTEYERGTVTLTPLGRQVVDPTQEQRARVDAFLKVGLYRAIYEQFKGYTLPPRAALEREMAKLGVSSKQTSKARIAFERSANQAGFDWAGADRLVMPVLKGEGTPPPDEVVPSKPLETGTPGSEQHNFEHGGGGGGGGGNYHPFIDGLLRELPPPGGEWPEKERAKWLSLAINAFDMIYKGGGELQLTVAQKKEQ